MPWTPPEATDGADAAHSESIVASRGGKRLILLSSITNKKKESKMA